MRRGLYTMLRAGKLVVLIAAIAHSTTARGAESAITAQDPSAADFDVSASLRQLALEAGINLEIRGELGGQSQAIHIEGLSTLEAIERLSTGHSLVILDSANSANPKRIIVIATPDEAPTSSRSLLTAQLEHKSHSDTKPHHADEANEDAVALRQVVELSNSADSAAIEKLSKIAISGDEPALRSAALSALSTLQGRQISALLKQGLRDSAPEVRITAARALLWNFGDGAISTIQAAANAEQDEQTKAELQILAKGKLLNRPKTNMLLLHNH